MTHREAMGNEVRGQWQRLDTLIKRPGTRSRVGCSGVWGGQGLGETCDACEGKIAKDEFAIGGVVTVEGIGPMQFHVRCFWTWDTEVGRIQPSGGEAAAIATVRESNPA
jgi:hypothetical protein